MAAPAAHLTPDKTLSTEFEAFAEPFVASGRYANSTDVLHAAMEAFLRAEITQQAYDKACEEAAEEGERSGIAEGDVMARLREEFGLKGRAQL